MLLKGAICRPEIFHVRIGRERQHTAWKSLWIQSQCEREHSLCFFPSGVMEPSAFFSCLLIVSFYSSSVLPSILTLFFPLPFHFPPENLSIFYISLAYRQEHWNTVRLARNLRFRYLEIWPDVNKNAKLLLSNDLWDCVYVHIFSV